jgi:hypothetical protein
VHGGDQRRMAMHREGKRRWAIRGGDQKKNNRGKPSEEKKIEESF